MAYTLPDAIDRLLLVSRQPNQRRAAAGLAGAFVRALAKVTNREGLLIAQLDELLEPYAMLVAEQPFMPSEPVALCLTGTPRLVQAVYVNLLSVTKVRFVPLRPLAAVDGLRVCSMARDGQVTFDTHREFGEVDFGKLTKGGWQVEVAGGEELCPAIVAAEGLLRTCASLKPTRFAPPGGPAKAAPRPKQKSVLDGIPGFGRRKIGRRRSR